MNGRLFALKLHRLPLILVLTFSLALLAGRDCAAERAEKHYQAAFSLVAAGGEERALVELRNVFQFDGRHRGAGKLVAALQRERGDTREEIARYLWLVEQFSDGLDGQCALGELYLGVGNWPESTRHAGAALKQKADDDASIKQAYAIAKRLRGSEASLFQDTYERIAYLRDQPEEAV